MLCTHSTSDTMFFPASEMPLSRGRSLARGPRGWEALPSQGCPQLAEAQTVQQTAEVPEARPITMQQRRAVYVTYARRWCDGLEPK